MEQAKEYYAFISYKREDEKWAKWLQNKLEHYRFPTNLNGRTDLPKNIRPTFRDVTDLKPGLLAEEINSALRNSEWLIVVCSPRSARSPWVCKEAQTFIDLGRGDHIIPFVIEGNPFSSDTATECYPEALLNLTGSKELLAANINEMGRDAAVIKVVARMFNLRFDALWQRYEREQKRRRWMWIGGAVFLAILGLSIGIFFVKQNRTIENQNAQLKNAASRLREDSIALANHVSRIRADSMLLSLQKDSIQRTTSLLRASNVDLEKANIDLKSANMEILNSNWNLKVSNAKIMAERVIEKINAGDAVSGVRLLREICSDSEIDKLMYLPEIEKALRASYCYQFKKGVNGQVIIEDVGTVSLAGFCDDDKSIYAVLNDTSVVKYDAKTGRFLGEIGAIPSPNSKSDYYVYAYDHLSNSLIYSIDNLVCSYNVVKREHSIVPISCPSFVEHIVVSPSYDYIAYCIEYPDNKPYEWYISNLKASTVSSYMIPECEMVYAFSPNGKKCLVDIKGNYYLYDIERKKSCFQIQSDYIENAHFCAGGDYILINTSRDNEVKGYGKVQKMNVFCISEKKYINYGDTIINDGYFTPVIQESPKNNYFAVGKHDGEIKISTRVKAPDIRDQIESPLFGWDNSIISLRGHQNKIESIDFNNHGTSMLSVSKDMIRLWNVNLPTAMNLLQNNYDNIASNGTQFIGKTDSEMIAVADVNEKKMIGSPLYKAKTGFRCKIISRDNEVVVAEKDSFLYVFNPTKNDGFKVKFGCPAYLLKLSISQDGSRLAVSNSQEPGSLSIFDTKKKEEMVWVDSLPFVSNISMNPDGKTIAVSSFDKHLEIRDVETLAVKYKLSGGHTGYVQGLAFSPDGGLMASIGSDRILCIWDMKKKKLLKKIYSKYQYHGFYGCSISTDNKYVAASVEKIGNNGKENIAYIWNIKTGEVVEINEDISPCWFCQDVPNKIYYCNGARYWFYNFPQIEEIVEFYRR